jgi:methylated-DNA-[protein]-cysteine S-methyltransferase
MLHLTLGTYKSPLGEIVLVTDDEGRLRALDYADHQSRLHRLLREHYGDHELTSGPIPLALVGRLDRYFQGELTALEDVEVVTEGTATQKMVWAALRAIPAGQTKSYGQLAKELGLSDPLAAREIGEVNNANPVAIVVPCHRIIAKDGKLKGYAGGIHRKKWLLEHEKALNGIREEPAAPQLPGF